MKTENNPRPVQEGSPVVYPTGERGWVVASTAAYDQVAVCKTGPANREIRTAVPGLLQLDLDHPVGRQHAATWVVRGLYDVRPEIAIMVACDSAVLALRWVTSTGYPAHVLWNRTNGKPRGVQGVEHPLRPIPAIPPRMTPEDALKYLYGKYQP